MAHGTYNGFSNYETWCANLWLGNSEESSDYWLEQATEAVKFIDDETDPKAGAVSVIAAQLESEHDEAMPEVEGVFGDLLRAALGAVDWREIARSYVDQVTVYSAGWNMPGYMPDNAPALFTDSNNARQYIIDAIKQHEDEEEDEDKATELCHAAEEVNLERGEFGRTVCGYHYFVTKV